jgi:hypothetical protein
MFFLKCRRADIVVGTLGPEPVGIRVQIAQPKGQ